MRSSYAIVLFACALLLSGCSGTPVLTSTATGSVPGAAITGKVHGGQNAISGAHVYLLAVSTTAYGGPGIPASSNNASVLLLTSGSGSDSLGYYVTTDSNGNFSITNDYTCPSAYKNTYVYAVGGNPGLASGTNNTAATLVAPVSTCNTTNFVWVNEVSTIAAIYATAGFITDPTNVGYPGSSTLAETDFSNAVDTIENLYTPTTGVALATTLGGNGTVPQAEINTLANILAACINSTGPTSTPCATLFANAMNGSTPPTDTATAAVNIAHNPGANIANLCGLQTATSPFQPDLSCAAASLPNDFTIAIVYTGGGLDSPGGIAVDGSGNVWVPNRGNATLSAFNPVGAVLSGSPYGSGSEVSDPIGVAFDGSGDAWASDYAGAISEYSPSSSMWLSGASGITGGDLYAPWGIAIDTANDVWVANSAGNSISEYSPSSAKFLISGFTSGGLSAPYGVAIDVSGNVWVANQGGNSISEFNSSGSPVSSTGYSGGGLDAPYSIAIDGSGNVWAPNFNGKSISEFSPPSLSPPDGMWLSGTGFTGGGLSNPSAIAIDGSGNVWVADEFSGSISEFNSSGTAISGSNGYTGYAATGSTLDNPYAIAIDGSGNIWVPSYSANTLTEFVGAASPVVTPIVANLLPPYAANNSAVNKP